MTSTHVGRFDEPAQAPRILSYWSLMSDQGAITHDILNHEYAGSGTEDDPYRVTWIHDDSRNPLNFTMKRKIVIMGTTAFATLIVSFTSSAYIGSLSMVIKHFDVSNEVATLGLSLFILGFAIGPLIWRKAPLSETIGRQIPFFFSFLIMAAFSASCAGAQNIESLIVLRFFAGAFGSSPLTNAGGVISDLFNARQRGLGLCLFAATPYLGMYSLVPTSNEVAELTLEGPALGPSIGGFLGSAAGWRWVEGFLASCTVVCWVLMAILVPETYAPVLLRKRAEKLTKITGKHYGSKTDLEKGKATLTKRLQTALSRPWILLAHEPIVLLFTFYAAIVYGTLYMLFGAFPVVYEQGRGWSAGQGGLPFLGVMIGIFLGTGYAVFDNKRYVRVQEAHRGFAPPEARLPLCMVSSVALPIGMFWFAFSNSPSTHWIASVSAMVPFGFGIMLIYLGIVNYLLDAYTIYAASVLAGMSIIRYMFGAIFPLFTTPMYRALGIHWASAIPAFVSVLCLPIPFLFYKYGPAIRTRCKYAAESQQYMQKLQEAATGSARVQAGSKEFAEKPEPTDHTKPEDLELQRVVSAH
ncbi:uncharacterized protein A1O9_11635 [Exophiala aquamarina CBS 119918]|uniref:Major facilitator superfamily (MFS) profile domain-containing protein n=1 Tax=Exophiala aquamarina CBS 119918 TaxID=1182545 RepID=A0A072NX11_9EURO|nr:uncharacterized protein A1O9_11635 [Exophiala aquamarina CBS 119918]KEF52394.1 hypothetical protein A1O9_11635 [Exophiala aquamarina CBS 119918]